MSQQVKPSAPEKGEEETHSLLSIPGTRCFLIEGNNKKVIGKGEFQVLSMDDDSLLFYIADVFQYVITKEFPSMKATSYSFVFPAVNHTCWGVVFPANTSNEDIEMFEGLLTQYSQYQTTIEEIEGDNDDEEKKEIDKETKDEKIGKMGKKVAEYIKKGSIIAQQGIQKGTIIVTKGIRKAKDEMKLRIKVRESVKVSDKTKQRIEKAKLASQTVVKVSKAVVIGAKAACNELTTVIADSAAKTEWGKKIAQNDDPKLQAAKDIGKETLMSILLLYEELENAAIILVAEVADASAEVATYKYGDEFGKEVAYKSADIVKDSSLIVKNVTDLGIKHVAKTVVANAAVDVMSDDNEKQINRQKREEQQKSQINQNINDIALATVSLSQNSNNNVKYDM